MTNVSGYIEIRRNLIHAVYVGVLYFTLREDKSGVRRHYWSLRLVSYINVPQ